MYRMEAWVDVVESISSSSTHVFYMFRHLKCRRYAATVIYFSYIVNMGKCGLIYVQFTENHGPCPFIHTNTSITTKRHSSSYLSPNFLPLD
jgi:hypothetical protein